MLHKLELEHRNVVAPLLLSSRLTRRVAAQQRWRDGLVPAGARFPLRGSPGYHAEHSTRLTDPRSFSRSTAQSGKMLSPLARYRERPEQLALR
jgi:hypothetical protein